MFTFGNFDALLVQGLVEVVVLDLQLVDLLVEFGLDFGSLQLDLLQRLQPPLDGRRQRLKNVKQTVS